MIVFNQYPLGETRVQREAEALLRAGCEVDVICKCMPGEPQVDGYKGVRIFRERYHFPTLFLDPEGLPQRFLDYLRFFLSAFFRLNRLHFQQRYASLQVHNLPDFLVFCTLIPKISGVPVILDLHDLMPEFFAGRFGTSNSLKSRLIRWQERLSCLYADHVITVSDPWRQALIQRGVPANKCSVLMNVADDQVFKATSQTRSISGHDGFRLIYHGSLVYRYGLDLAIDAIDQLRGEIPGLHLNLVGQGEYLPDIRRLVEQKHLEKHVTIQPKHLAEELPGIIQSCDLGIVPYRADIFTDGLLPTKLMEYAALGMPAIAARTSAIQAYFNHANVEFFEPGDARDLARCIRILYRQPDRMEELRRGSQNFNEQFNWASLSVDFVALVNGLQRRLRSLAVDSVP